MPLHRLFRNGRFTPSSRASYLVAAGGLALLVGLFVYLTARDPSRALLIPSFGGLFAHHWPGPIEQSSPSFLHAFAFSLFTAAALPSGAASKWVACAGWGTINVAFEFAQLPVFKPQWAEALQGGVGQWAIPRAFLQYFLRGTFDVNDVLAAVLGALAAAALIFVVDNEPETRHVLERTS